MATLHLCDPDSWRDCLCAAGDLANTHRIDHMTFKYSKLSGACVAYLLSCAALHAQTQTQTQSASIRATANDTVVVSGSRSASKLSETAASIGPCDARPMG